MTPAALRPAENDSALQQFRTYLRQAKAWSTDGGSTASASQLVRKVIAEFENGAHPVGRLLSAASAGDVELAVTQALALLRDERRGYRREAVRALVAAAIAARDDRRAAALFDEAAGWRPNDPVAPASAILFVDAALGCATWQAALLERCSVHAQPHLRIAALTARIRAAMRSGLDEAALGRLVEHVITEREANDGLGRRMATLLWMIGPGAFAPRLFARFPRLVAKAEGDPVLARLIIDHASERLSPELAPAVDRSAARLTRLEQDTEAFWRGLASPALRIAVVGNSPCEIGRSRGVEIDRHDVIIRFNLAPESEAFAADYGARCDVRMAPSEQMEAAVAATAATALVMRQSHVVSKGFSLVEAAAVAGRRIAFIPETLQMRLAARLRKLPSSGLLMLAGLRDRRGSLSGVDCYGFSLVDQLADPSAAQYFRSSRPGDHDWAGERALLDGWLAEAVHARVLRSEAPDGPA